MTTNNRGLFSIQLEPGEYDLSVRENGFVSFTTHFQLSASTDVRKISVVLEPGSGGHVEVVPEDTSRASTPPAPPKPGEILSLSSYYHPEKMILSIADIKSLPHTTLTVHNVHTDADETYSGVPLISLLAKLNGPIGKELNGMDFAGYVIATATDRYVAILSIAEIDPTFHPGQVLIADSMNGKPLDTQNGPFKLIVTEDNRPARWVRNLISIEVKTAH